MQKVTVGIDIGTESAKIVLGAANGCEIVRNEVGGHTTPTVVSFAGQQRNIGATASAKSKDSVSHLNRLLADELSGGDDSMAAFYPFAFQSESTSVDQLEYNGATRSFSNSALLAMLLGQIQRDVQATMNRLLGEAAGGEATSSIKYAHALSCPPDFSDKAQQQLLDAAYAAGWEDVVLVPRSTAYQACYYRKFPEHASDKTVLVVDMGHAETTVLLLGPDPAATTVSGEDADAPAVPAATPTPTPTQVLASVRHKGLGAGTVDVRLWEHFQSTVPALQHVTKTSRGGRRLLAGMTKLKHLLSQLPKAAVTVENVGEHDTDLKLDGTRSSLVELCETDRQALTALIERALGEANLNTDQVDSVEIVGGGCRIPWVKQAIEKATGTTTLSYSLDDTSAALGAALIGEDVETTVFLARSAVEPTDAQVMLRKEEETMATLDTDMQERAATLNQMEAHILELRSAKHVKHGQLLPAELFTYLDDTENWLFSEEADTATKDELLDKWKDTQAKTAEWSKEYAEALDVDHKAKDAEMEAEAKLAQKERGGEEDEEDHDNRRLPKKRRMEIVIKNKKEGGELFSDGNYKFAAARYAKALSHCAKFVDLNPEDLEEVKSVKLTLNMNLGLAWLKMENPDQALRYCNDAVALDDQNTKALYRRASVYYEKKNWAEASKDLKKAAQGAPEDKAISKLQEKIDAQIKLQKAKEKKMAQKMFG